MTTADVSVNRAIRELTNTLNRIQKNHFDNVYDKIRVYHGTYLGNGLVSCNGKKYPCQQGCDMFCVAGQKVYCQLVGGNYAVIIGG